MLPYAVALLLVNGSFADKRIVGGADAPTGRYQYYSSLYSGTPSEDNFVCGASLIAPDMVLTAAHCDQRNFQVSVGNGDIDSDGIVSEIARKFPHADYNPFSIRNDIMILKLETPVQSVTPVILNFDEAIPATQQELTVIGLGQLSQNGGLPDKLQFVNVDEFPFEECEDRYSPFGGGFFGDFFEDFFSNMEETEQVCAGGDGISDSCFGDSGGPLVVNGGSSETDVQVGLTSYGQGCAQVGSPGVYTRISGYEDWIKTRVCEFSAFPPDYCDGFVATDPVASPTPSPGGGGGLGDIIGSFGGFCFSGVDSVEVANVGSIQMTDLKIGDSILVSPGKYEQVYSFGHYQQSKEAEFLQIETEHANLEVTKDHLVFVEGGKSIPASELKEGMQLIYGNDLATIEGIGEVTRQGIYAPFTASGKLMVNGFQVSCFVAINESATINILGFDLHYQFLSQIFESPHRLVCNVFGSCPGETYNDEGISSWNALPFSAFQWLLKQHPIVLTAGFLLGFIAVGSVAAFEFLVTSSLLASLLFWQVLSHVSPANRK